MRAGSRLALTGVQDPDPRSRSVTLEFLPWPFFKWCNNSGYPLLPHLKTNGAEVCEHSESNAHITQNRTGPLCALSHQHLTGPPARAAADHKHRHKPVKMLTVNDSGNQFLRPRVATLIKGRRWRIKTWERPLKSYKTDPSIQDSECLLCRW